MAIEGWTLAFTLGLTVLTGVVFGLVPAWQAARTRIGDRLAARGALGTRRDAFLRDLLVVSEMALALVLLIGAGLTLRSLAAASAIDPGFEPRGLLTMSVSVQGSSAAEPGQRALFFPAALEALRRLPGVDAAGAVNHAPLVGDLWTRSFDIAGRTRVSGDSRPGAVYRVVLPGYFSTLRLPVLRGRDVATSDTALSPGVVVVSETLAARNFPTGDAVGQHITLGDPADPAARWMTIVGVVRDAVGYTWEGGADPTIYLPFLQTESYVEGREGHTAYLNVMLRTNGDPAALAGAARQAIWSVHPGVSISEVTTMSAAVDRALARPRFQSALLASFAALALVLAAAGLYGVMSYAVAQRTREIGLRLTLGARRGDVLRLILAQALRRLAIGGAIGLAGAWLTSRALTTLLYGVQPTDPLTFGAVPVILALTALAASYLPARRAARVDPMVALRVDG
jgi:predicted permease